MWDVLSTGDKKGRSIIFNPESFRDYLMIQGIIPDKEVGGVGTYVMEENNYKVIGLEDATFSTSSAGHQMGEEEIAKALSRLMKRFGAECLGNLIWWHSHPGFSPTPSTVDDSNVIEFLDDSPEIITVIFGTTAGKIAIHASINTIKEKETKPQKDAKKEAEGEVQDDLSIACEECGERVLFEEIEVVKGRCLCFECSHPNRYFVDGDWVDANTHEFWKKRKHPKSARKGAHKIYTNVREDIGVEVLDPVLRFEDNSLLLDRVNRLEGFNLSYRTNYNKTYKNFNKKKKTKFFGNTQETIAKAATHNKLLAAKSKSFKKAKATRGGFHCADSSERFSGKLQPAELNDIIEYCNDITTIMCQLYGGAIIGGEELGIFTEEQINDIEKAWSLSQEIPDLLKKMLEGVTDYYSKSKCIRSCSDIAVILRKFRRDAALHAKHDVCREIISDAKEAMSMLVDVVHQLNGGDVG